jgi:ATP-dependent DNA helicase RecQ
VAEQEIGKQLLLETVAYAESALCRRKLLLHIFGEVYEPENCETCDNCRTPKPPSTGSLTSPVARSGAGTPGEIQG